MLDKQQDLRNQEEKLLKEQRRREAKKVKK